MTKFTTTAQDGNASEPLPDGGVGIERQHIVAPEDGTLTVAINGTEHEYALKEGDDIVFEWQGGSR